MFVRLSAAAVARVLYCLTAVLAGLTPWPAGRAAAPAPAKGATGPSGAGHVNLPILPSSYYAGTLGVLDGRIVVGDNTGGTSCRLAFVQPAGLRVLSDRTTSCNDPRLVGENVMPVESLPYVGSQTGLVRIATRNRHTGTVGLGPVVMKYGNYSDGRPEWTYGGGSLWLYDVGTPSGAQLLRISLSAGTVLATVKMPALSRVLLSAGPQGLWFAQSLESGWPSGKPRPALVYFVGVGVTRPEVVPQRGEYLNWLVTSAGATWADVQTGDRSQLIETFSGPRAAPSAVEVAGTNAQVPSNFGEGPFDAPPVLYAPGPGLVYAWPGWRGYSVGGSSQQDIVKLDPATGRTTKLSVLAAPGGAVQANLVYGGDFYLLVGTQGGGEATLYRAPLGG